MQSRPGLVVREKAGAIIGSVLTLHQECDCEAEVRKMKHTLLINVLCDGLGRDVLCHVLLARLLCVSKAGCK